MTRQDDRRASVGIRREPPPFRPVKVLRAERRTPHLASVRFGGEQLRELRIEEPAASVRLLLPSSGSRNLVFPTWNGNEFLLDDGSRPIIRTFTPLDFDRANGEMTLEVVLHEGGAASSWAESAAPGDRAAISGPGRGYRIVTGAGSYFLAGDETALPAIGQLIAAMPDTMAISVVVEVTHPDAMLQLPGHPRLTTEWVVLPVGSPPGAALVPAVENATIASGTKIWAAGEAGAMQRIRRHLFDDRRLERGDVTVRGYWKHGR